MRAGGCLLAGSYRLGRYRERAKGMKMAADGANLSREICSRKELGLLPLVGLLGLGLARALDAW